MTDEDDMLLKNKFSADDYMDKKAINNMRKKLVSLRKKKMGIPENQKIGWLETLHVTSAHPIEMAVIDSIHDDSKKELAFYNITIKNVEQGLKKAIEKGMLVHKPIDYYAEMLKTEDQMKRIQVKKEKEEERIKKIEERKRNYECKKFSKEVRAKKQTEKGTKRKQFQQMIEKSRKSQKFDFDLKDSYKVKKNIKKIKKRN